MPDLNLLPRPVAEVTSVEDLVGQAREGVLRVPSFQRPFRWAGSDIARLFDSILHGYPVGNLLLWERGAPAADLRFGPVSVTAPGLERARFVVDGQQRLTSLIGVLAAPEGVSGEWALHFDLVERRFRHPGRRAVPAAWLPMREVLDTKQLFKWLRGFEETGGSDAHIDLAETVAKRVREYKIPVSVVGDVDESTLRQIFDRMNNYGKRMRKDEVFHALHAATGDEAPNDLRDLGREVAALGFGTLRDETLMRALLATRGGDPYREFRDEFSDSKDRHGAYRATAATLERVVTFLQGTVGIPHERMLPYVLVVPVLARFFHLYPEPEARTRVLLRRWVWRVFATKVGSGSASTQLTRNLVGAIEKDEHVSAQALLAALPAFPTEPVDLTAARLSQASARMNLALLGRLVPLHLETGEPIEVAELFDGDEGLLRLPAAEGLARPFARLLLHPPIDDQALAEVIARAPDKVLRSHLLPHGAALADVAASQEVGALLERRAELMARELTDRLLAAAEPTASDHPALASLGLSDDE